MENTTNKLTAMKLNEAQRRSLKSKIISGSTTQDLMKEFNVSQSTISYYRQKQKRKKQISSAKYYMTKKSIKQIHNSYAPALRKFISAVADLRKNNYDANNIKALVDTIFLATQETHKKTA